MGRPKTISIPPEYQADDKWDFQCQNFSLPKALKTPMPFPPSVSPISNYHGSTSIARIKLLFPLPTPLRPNQLTSKLQKLQFTMILHPDPVKNLQKSSLSRMHKPALPND
ncbi:hypothetical protein GBA52_015272 [Prunus armeniaca]|nr:hypothetical protein GBA52_015272 [Prunus armeniaca]